MLGLQREVAAWADQVFPGQTTLAKIKHLAREARELFEEPGDRAELADCLILTLHIAHRQQMTADQLIGTAAGLETHHWRKAVHPILEQVESLIIQAENLVDNPEDKSLTAACFVRIGHLAKCQFLTMGQLVECAAQKLAVNKLREWDAPDAEGIYHHKP